MLSSSGCPPGLVRQRCTEVVVASRTTWWAFSRRRRWPVRVRVASRSSSRPRVRVDWPRTRGRSRVVLPGASGCAGGTLSDITSGEHETVTVGYCGPSFQVVVPFNVAAGDQLSLTINGVTLPSTPGLQEADIYTTADQETTTSYTTTPPNQVSSIGLQVSPSVAAATQADYTIEFTTSGQGALAANAGTITVDLPGASGCAGGTLTDVTTGVSSPSRSDPARTSSSSRSRSRSAPVIRSAWPLPGSICRPPREHRRSTC